MTKILNRALIALLLTTTVAYAGGGPNRAYLVESGAKVTVCRVADPTPTPLNVRNRPGGITIATLDNGIEVVIQEKVTYQNHPWLFVITSPNWVGPNDLGHGGWVYGDFIVCKKELYKED